jgi:hypothetical protein
MACRARAVLRACVPDPEARIQADVRIQAEFRNLEAPRDRAIVDSLCLGRRRFVHASNRLDCLGLLRYGGDVFGVFGRHGNYVDIIVYGVGIIEFVWNEQHGRCWWDGCGRWWWFRGMRDRWAVCSERPV